MVASSSNDEADAIRPLGRATDHYPMLKSLVYLGFLILLSFIEEIAVGLIHGRSLTRSVAEIADGSVVELVTSCFLLWLILVPVVGIRQLDNFLGNGVLHRAFFGTGDLPPKSAASVE